MIENVVRGIGGVASYGVISICIFFAFFGGMLIWAVRLKKPYLSSMQSLPLEDPGSAGISPAISAATNSSSSSHSNPGEESRTRTRMRTTGTSLEHRDEHSASAPNLER